MRHRHVTAVASAVFALLVLNVDPARVRLSGASVLELGIREENFTVNGTSKFLVFVSYFDALDVSATNLHSDFAYLRQRGVDGIRIFPNWWDVRQDVWSAPSQTYYPAPDTVIAGNGSLRNWTKFLQVLDIAKEESLLVDVSFSAESVPGLNLTNYRNAIANIAGQLASAGSKYKHVLFDIQNEYNKSSNGPSDANPMSDSQVRSIRDAIKAKDRNRIVTASISSSASASSAGTKAKNANLDSTAYHHDRNPGYWTRVPNVLSAIQISNPDPPIYLQEPAKLEPGNDDWLNRNGFGADVFNARTYGAAAWCFHNGGSFRMDGSNLQNKLRAEEKAFLSCLRNFIRYGTC